MAEDNTDDGGVDPTKLLADIRKKAERLLNQLMEEQAELDRNPPKLAPEAIAEGRAAMIQAIAAARQTIEALDAAASGDLPEDAEPGDQAGGEHRWN